MKIEKYVAFSTRVGVSKIKIHGQKLNVIKNNSVLLNPENTELNRKCAKKGIYFGPL